MKAMAEDADRDSYALEMAAKQVSQLTTEALRIFKLIVENSNEKKAPGFPVMQRGLHEYMIKTLYHIDRSCRKLLEAQVDFEKYDGLEDYLQSLQKRHSLSNEQVNLAGQEWFANEELIFYKLVERECKLRVFGGETHQVCFQIYNADDNPILHARGELCTSNGLLISKYYFVEWIFKFFQHLMLITQILELEKTGSVKDENTQEVELEPGVMETFNQAAQEYFNR